MPAVHEREGGSLESAVVLAQSTRLNAIDALRQERGYYETLSRTSWVNEQGVQGKDRVPLGELGASQPTNDLRGEVLEPNIQTLYKGVKFTTNQWGMRDRNYQLAKPDGTFRIALIGSSHVMGSGVADEETFENLVEDRLNRELIELGFEHYEILNFSMSGYGLLQTLYIVERVIPPFEPDMVIYVLHPGEERRLIERLRRILNSRIEVEPEYQYVMSALRQANADKHLPESEFLRRLEPYQEDLLRWAFHRQITAIRAQGALPVFVYMPLTDARFGGAELRFLSKIAEESGAQNLTLDNVYDDFELNEIQVSESDNHPNVLGHRLIADRLYAELIKNVDALGLVTPQSER
jgi:hypothetical protein